MNFSYSQLKNKLCPLRHYFTINQNNNEMLKPITIGNITHKLYAQILKERNPNINISEYIKNELIKDNKYNENIENNIKKHIHTSILKKIPKKAFIEKQLVVSTDKLPHLGNIVNIHCKPDIFYIDGDVATICEIKTNAYSKYDPLQLQFYAWCISIHNKDIQHFVLKVFYTALNKMQVVELIKKEDLQDTIDRYFYSSQKAYTQLTINTLTEALPVLATLISTDSTQLTSLFNIIHPEQCVSCNSSIICPAYQKEVTSIFTSKIANSTNSDILISIN